MTVGFIWKFEHRLIVSLGIISKLSELVIIEAAVFLLVAQALVINRLAGLPYRQRSLKSRMRCGAAYFRSRPAPKLLTVFEYEKKVYDAGY